MTKEKLEREAEKWLNKWELCNKCENKVDCISNFSYCKKVVLQSYLASAEPREKRIAELEKENAELKEKLKEELKTIADKDLSFVARFDALEKENAELKSENQKWKDEWQEQVQKATDEGYARTLQTIQLTKAKELLERFLGLGNLWDLDCKDYFPLRKEAEQFLSEVENG